MTGTEKIKKVLEYKNINANQLAKALDMKRSQGIYDIIDGTVDISKAMAGKIVKAYPEFNRTWLLTGEGDMTKCESTPDSLPENEDEMNISPEALLEIIRSNKIMAQAHEKQAEANRQQAEANKLLAESNAMLLKKAATAGGHEEIHKAFDSKIGDVLLLLADVASGQRFDTKEQAVRAFHKRLRDIQRSNATESILSDGGRKGKQVP